MLLPNEFSISFMVSDFSCKRLNSIAKSIKLVLGRFDEEKSVSDRRKQNLNENGVPVHIHYHTSTTIAALRAILCGQCSLQHVVAISFIAQTLDGFNGPTVCNKLN